MGGAAAGKRLVLHNGVADDSGKALDFRKVDPALEVGDVGRPRDFHGSYLLPGLEDVGGFPCVRIGILEGDEDESAALDDMGRSGDGAPAPLLDGLEEFGLARG